MNGESNNANERKMTNIFERCAHVGRDNIMALTTSKRILKIREDHCEIEHELVSGL